ncbi:MAG: hypothetical protein J5I50_03185, partial [Chitinophagaceae bacterium]|nr:hypothetical protein [Chitinophagaceae bacterium]
MKTNVNNRFLHRIGKFTGILTFSLLIILALTGCKKETVADIDNTEYNTLISKMQGLWSDHMQWTYGTVDAFFNNQSSLNSSLERLLQNQKDIGDAIVPYYGKAAGDALTELLTTHINEAVPVLTAAKEGNSAALEAALADWYLNAKEIGDFLANANPHWAQTEMRDMMKMHIDQTTEYSVFLLQKDYDNAIRVFDEAAHHMRMMADMMSEG